MKRFEYRLQRVLELRKQQYDAQKARLQALRLAFERLETEAASVLKQRDEARAYVKHAPSSSGDDFAALALFEKHTQRRIELIAKQKDEINQQIAQQQMQTREADRKVRLLENLKTRRLAEWTIGRDKELEELAADSYLARLLATRRSLSGAYDDGGIPAAPSAPPEV